MASEIETEREVAEVSSLLKEWRMPLTVIASFKTAQVTKYSLPLLPDSLLKKLIPSEVPRAVFDHHLALFKANLPVVISETPEAAGQKRSLPESELEEDPVPPKKSRDLLNEDSPAINDLHQLLRRPPADGHVILAFYQTNDELSDGVRDKLVEKVIYSEIGSNYDTKISKTRFEELAVEIVELFPNESKCIYYEIIHKPVGTGVKLVKVLRGRLREKWYAVRRLFYKAGLLSKDELVLSLDTELVVDDPASSNSLVDVDDDDDDDYVWICGNNEPWVEVTRKWEATFTRRMQKRKHALVSAYMSLFPGLNTLWGAELLLRDADKLQPELSEASDQWPVFLQKVLRLILKRKPSLKIPESATQNERNATILVNIQLIFKVRSLPKPKGQKVALWKPSKKEVGEAFLLHVKNIGDIKGLLDARKRRLARHGFKLQAVPVIVGDLSEIRQSFVVIDDYRWEARDPLHAIEVALKLSFGLDTAYPPEARHLWLFIQRLVYKVVLPNDFTDDVALKPFIEPYIKEYERLV